MRVAVLMTDTVKQTHLQTYLNRVGVDSEHYTLVAPLIHEFASKAFDAVVLGDEGVAQLGNWLGALRRQLPSSLPVLVIGCRPTNSLAQAVAQGASDFSVIRDSADELILRIQAHVQLRKLREREVIRVGNYTLLPQSNCIYVADKEVRLTTREFSLAWMLFSAPGKVVNFRTLADQIWGRSSDICKRTIEQHVYKLRCKLQLGDASDVKIHAAYGVGYRLHLETTHADRADMLSTSKDSRDPASASHTH